MFFYVNLPILYFLVFLKHIVASKYNPNARLIKRFKKLKLESFLKGVYIFVF